jgi:hypothetical protein
MRQLLAHRHGEDHNQQARNNKGRNLCPTVRPARQRARPRDLLSANEFPAELMKVTKAGPRVQSDRDQEERPGQNAGKHSCTTQICLRRLGGAPRHGPKLLRHRYIVNRCRSNPLYCARRPAHSQTIGPAVLKTLIPRSHLQVWATAQAIRLLPQLPARARR